jgi:hypothetical protein
MSDDDEDEGGMFLQNAGTQLPDLPSNDHCLQNHYCATVVV